MILFCSTLHNIAPTLCLPSIYPNPTLQSVLIKTHLVHKYISKHTEDNANIAYILIIEERPCNIRGEKQIKIFVFLSYYKIPPTFQAIVTYKVDLKKKHMPQKGAQT